jgi:poly-gamma-glutamate system protein
MYKSDIKSIRVIGTLAIISLVLFIIVENSRVLVKQRWYSKKMEAARLMQLAEKTIREFRLKEGIFVDPVNDPNQTMLIGQEQTLITTDRGNLESKLTSLNPNFAAVMVNMLKQCNVEEGDPVAVAFSGSMPAMNIAVLCAIEVLEAKPIIISSVGASMWGANDPEFTWLDMEKLLYDKKLIRSRTAAASIGGGDDIGRGLSPAGRDLLIESINRNDVIFINEPDLLSSINRRVTIYDSLTDPDEKLKAYVNVGGGLGSLGSGINANLIPPGVSKQLAMRNFPTKGAMIKIAERGVPVIHISEINEIAEKYGLPVAPTPLPEPGEGEVFIEERYNLWVAGGALAILAGLILSVVIVDTRRHRLKR